jgi:hypothetical protein
VISLVWFSWVSFSLLYWILVAECRRVTFGDMCLKFYSRTWHVVGLNCQKVQGFNCLEMVLNYFLLCCVLNAFISSRHCMYLIHEFRFMKVR